MNRSKTKALIPVLVAWSEGRDIQHKHRNHTNWSDETLEDPNFEAEGFEWRVKPEPRERWVIGDRAFYNKAVAQTANHEGWEMVHYREVVGE